MNNQLIKEFYTDNEIKTFHGFRLLSIDGSQTQLPSSEELIDYYGVTRNQNGGIPMAQASTLFDVLNKITVDALIAPYKASERDLAIEHICNLVEVNKNTGFITNNIEDLFLFDRWYPSMELLITLHENKKDFIMRCPSLFLNVIQQAVKKGKCDQILEINFAHLSNSTKRKIKHKIGEAIRTDQVLYFGILLQILP